MISHCRLALFFALSLSCASVLRAAPFFDGFDDISPWKASNPKAPAEFSAADGILTLTDPPGGEATWGTSLYRDGVEADLDATPFFVARISEINGVFKTTFVNEKTKEKRSNLAKIAKPGFAIANLKEELGWSGKVKLSIGLYIDTEKTVKLDFIKFADRLSDEEKNYYEKADPMKQIGNQGLDAISARAGWRLDEWVEADGSWLSERTAFRDETTGASIWRMTNDPAVDQGDYYDIPAWNADGSLMTFMTQRNGANQRWLMNANGARLRPFPSEDGNPVGAGFWSVIDPGRFYTSANTEDSTLVIAIDPWSGKRETVVKAKGDLGSMQPPHPSERYFLFGSREDSFNVASAAHVVALDGTVRTAKFEKRWHRLRFTRSDDQRLFFNFDDPRQQFTILPDGTERVEISMAGGHPDWAPGGSELTFYTSGSVMGVRPDGSQLREVMKLGSGGHGGPTLDGDWFVSDTPNNGLFPGMVLAFRTDGSQTCFPIFRHRSSYYSHSTLWHPNHHSSHPHPNASPDGTKVLFNSDFLSEFTDIFVGVIRLPDPPRGLRLEQRGSEIALKWDKPARSREIQGYCIYGAADGGQTYNRLSGIVAETAWTGRALGPGAAYAVAAVERSGLESRASAAVFSADAARAVLRREAEDGVWQAPMREYSDYASASNLICIGREPDAQGGSIEVEFDAPTAGEYSLWARVKGEGQAAVSSGGSAQSIAVASAEWKWLSAGKAKWSVGRQAIAFGAPNGNIRLDALAASNDPAFVPEGALALDSEAPAAPAGLQAQPLSPNGARISWTAPQADDLDRFNLYRGSEPGFECSQSTIVASPSESHAIDWGLAFGQKYYYKVSAVDRAGNESAPAEAAALQLPEFVPMRIALEPDQAKTKKMKATAPGGAKQTVLIPDGNGSEAVWNFDLPRDGRYAIWAYSTHKNNARSSFSIALDEETSVSCRIYGPWEKWSWSPAGAKTSGAPQLFALPAGSHTLRLKPQTADSAIGRIILTDDPTFPDSDYGPFSKNLADK